MLWTQHLSRLTWEVCPWHTSEILQKYVQLQNVDDSDMGAVVKRKKQTNTNSLPLWPRGDAMCVSVCVCSAPQLFLPLCNPKICTPPGSSVYGISQARILEWIAISFSRGCSQTRDWTWPSCIGRRILYHWATWRALRRDAKASHTL